MTQPVGDPLPVADAAFLQDELTRRGITAQMKEAGEGIAVVEVDEPDHGAAERARREILAEEEALPPAAGRPARRRRHALLMAVAGMVGVLYVGRVLPRGIRAATALGLALLIYVAALPGDASVTPEAGNGDGDTEVTEE